MKPEYTQYLLEGEQAGARYKLAAPERPPAGATGAHLGRMAGASLEFKDHRDYQPGDDLRSLDWAAYARSDRLTVKLYREEINPHVDILVDGSRSMALEGTAKARAALGLAAALASAAGASGFSHRAWITGEGCAQVINGAERPSAWAGLDFESDSTPLDAMLRMPPRWRPQGMRVLVSDLLWLGEPLHAMRRLGMNAAAVTVVQLLGRADADPDCRGNVKLVDCETGAEEEILADAMALRRYRKALARHQQQWSRACRQAGAVLVTLVAEDLVTGWDLKELVQAEALKVA